MPLFHTGASRCAGTILPMIPKEVAVSILRKAALMGNFLLSIFECTLEDPPMVEQTHQNQSEQTPPYPPPF